jgi:CubicO group peptidase (beta-lactamase class C family)
MKWRGLIVFCGCISNYFGIAQNTLPADLSAEINRRVELKINQGISVCLIDSHQQTTHFYFGLEAEKGKPISKTSTFEIASITKTFSAALFYQYHQEGLISLDNEVREYLPDSLPEYIKQIRIRELLNHTSGLPKLHEEFWTTNWDNPYYDLSLIHN